MTLKSRRRIFYALVALFFIAGTAVILYAQGWRLDLETFHAEKVGAIFVHSFPSNAAITLKDIPEQNQSGLLSQGTLISDLFPGTYSLTLKATGYDDWHENADVLPTFVTKFDYAVLVPQTGTPAASGTVQSFAVVDGETIYENASGTTLWRGTDIGKGTIVSTSMDIKNVILKNGTAGDDILYDFTNNTSTNLTTLLAKNGITAKSVTSIAIDPYDATQVIVGGAQKISTIGLSDGGVTSIAKAATGEVFGPSVAVSQSSIAWAVSPTSTKGNTSAATTTITIYDKFAAAAVTNSASVAGTNVALKWISTNELGVLQSDGELYLYNAGAQTFQKLADDVTDFAASPDGSMIAALESHGIEIFPQTNDAVYARFNIPDAATAEKIFWYKDSDHLFVQYPDHVSFLSLDDTALTNFTTVSAGTSPYYDPQANSLYIISPNAELTSFDFPS